jgi:hypothetical protein
VNATQIYQNRLRRIRLATASHLTGMWDQLPGLDRPDAERFAASAVPVVDAAQKLTARTVSGFLAPKLGIEVPRLDPGAVTNLRNNVDSIEVYQRPFGVVWAALSAGVPYAEAAVRGRDRLDLIAQTDVWLAMRTSSDLVAQEKPDLSWVRVADPSACDLCSAADGESMDSPGDMAGHPNCGCTTEPVTGSTQAADPDLVEVHHDDETGLVLYQAGHEFAAA